eukprot:CAMPEP_0181355362 /NCGR_PEP_ID=MMETSP1106-20121128/3857_1 /TAXON_ID=81844 /ORGANISM="Mantoniella antarctica, Strain SL-175" /LENGTH=164 /DNA_ID=CAMNT_0023468093 /DNA_START=579 /DNA_END=1074 /DNA_ORIENTATION=+
MRILLCSLTQATSRATSPVLSPVLSLTTSPTLGHHSNEELAGLLEALTLFAFGRRDDSLCLWSYDSLRPADPLKPPVQRPDFFPQINLKRRVTPAVAALGAGAPSRRRRAPDPTPPSGTRTRAAATSTTIVIFASDVATAAVLPLTATSAPHSTQATCVAAAAN